MVDGASLWSGYTGKFRKLTESTKKIYFLDLIFQVALEEKAVLVKLLVNTLCSVSFWSLTVVYNLKHSEESYYSVK